MTGWIKTQPVIKMQSISLFRKIIVLQVVKNEKPSTRCYNLGEFGVIGTVFELTLTITVAGTDS